MFLDTCASSPRWRPATRRTPRQGDLIGRAAEGMRQPSFTAVTGPHCTFCPVRTSCPAIATAAPEVSRPVTQEQNLQSPVHEFSARALAQLLEVDPPTDEQCLIIESPHDESAAVIAAPGRGRPRSSRCASCGSWRTASSRPNAYSDSPSRGRLWGSSTTVSATTSPAIVGRSGSPERSAPAAPQQPQTTGPPGGRRGRIGGRDAAGTRPADRVDVQLVCGGAGGRPWDGHRAGGR